LEIKPFNFLNPNEISGNIGVAMRYSKKFLAKIGERFSIDIAWR